MKFCLVVVPSFSTRWPSNSISNHIRAALFPYMVWVIWNMFFLTFLNIYDVDITFRSIKGSMAVFNFNSTSKKHIKYMRQEPWMYVIVHAASKIENLLSFLYIRNTFRPFFSKNRMNVIFWTLDMNMNGDFCWFFMILYMYHYFKVKVRTRSLSLMSTLLTN